MLFRAIKSNIYNGLQKYKKFIPDLMSLLQSGDPSGVVKLKVDVFEAISIIILDNCANDSELKDHIPALINYFNLAVESRDPCPVEVSLIGSLFSRSSLRVRESLQYLDGCCLTFFAILARNEINTKLRSNCLATLETMARSVGQQNFLPYIARTLNQLEHASSITVKNVSFPQFFFFSLSRIVLQSLSFSCYPGSRT